MTTLALRSVNLARISRTASIGVASRTRTHALRSWALPTQLYAGQKARGYSSTPPEEPKDGKDKKDDKKVAGEKDGGKPAPGFENLYNEKHVMSKGSEDGASPDKQKFPLPGRVFLSESEHKELAKLLERTKWGLPQSQKDMIDQAKTKIVKEGVPIWLRDSMQQFKQRNVFDLATVAEFVKALRKFVFNEGEEPQQKSGAHDPGPGQEKAKSDQSDKKGSKSGGGGMAFDLDVGTTVATSFVAYLLYKMVVPGESLKEITWQEFQNTFLSKGLVEKLVVVGQSRVRVHLHREAVGAMYPDSPATNPIFHYYFTLGSLEAFESRLEKAQDELGIPSNERIPVSFTDESHMLGYLFSLAPTLLFIGGMYYLSKRGGGGSGSGIFSMGKSKAKRFNHESDVQVKFADVAGMDEAKQEIMEFVSFLKEPGIYQKLGAKIPRGAVLSGPPGTGKTLLAKATAGESGVPFFSVSGSEFVEMFVGVGASRVRDLFANARKNTPCIIFIDEIDAIGKSRGKNNFSGGNDEREATLNQILTEMDGFNTSEQVVVLAGTNRADVLDQALMRPGRFDRHISIDRPTMDGRVQIFGVHLKKIVTKEDLEFLKGRLAALTPGFAGADIANCVNEAALIAARYKADHVEMKHFEQAIERVICGLEKRSMVLSPEDKRTVAYHEAGHAICGWYFKYADPLLKVSIIPRGSGALGYAQYLPSGDAYLMNVNQLMDRMAMTLGGRVSEELHFETVTSGASDDFNKVTRMATAMVTKWGMSKKIGYVSFDDDGTQQFTKPFSEETARSIDTEVRRIVDEAHKQCKDLLIAKKHEVGLVAEELLSKEMLDRDDLDRILGPRPWGDPKDFAKYFGSKGDRQGAGSGLAGPGQEGITGEGGISGGGGISPTFRGLR